MDTNLFEGFEAFSPVEAPEGSVTIQYGLSVKTVQIVGEATVAPSEGMNPVALAEEMVRKYQFNMPAYDLHVYVDGTEVPFDRVTLIPATARTVEFRQPGSEKGSHPVILPMLEWFTVETIAVDTTETYQPYWKEQIVGSIIDPSLLTLPKGIETRPGSSGYDLVKFSEAAELVQSKPVARFVSQVKKTGAMTAADLLKAIEGEILAITVDGKRAENLEHGYDAVMPGQVCRVFVKGTTSRVDLPVIVVNVTQPAPEVVEESDEDFDEVYEDEEEDYLDKRRGELEAMKAPELQRMLKEMTGKGIFSASKVQLVNAILVAEGYES